MKLLVILFVCFACLLCTDMTPVICMINSLKTERALFIRYPSTINSKITCSGTYAYNHVFSSIEVIAGNHYDIFETDLFWNANVFGKISSIKIKNMEIKDDLILVFATMRTIDIHSDIIVFISFKIYEDKIQSIQMHFNNKEEMNYMIDFNYVITIADLLHRKNIKNNHRSN